jgi:phospholipase C
MNRDELREKIDTIVVVIMENRSFDHVLGHLRHPEFGNRADLDGIEDLANPDYINPDADGEAIAPFWMPDAPLPSDLPHGFEAVQKQLAFSDITRSFLMTGFVKAFEDQFHTSVPKPPPMGLLRPADLPTTGALAAQYTVCDRWFACAPTSTAPNRLLSMCGATELRDTKGLLPDQHTVYDWLLEHGVNFRVYSAGLPFFLLMPRIVPLTLTNHFRRFDAFARDFAHDDISDWPGVIFIEPDYYDTPVHLHAPCDNHAPLPMAPGEEFLARIYGVLTARPERWARTALIVTYDEHGGFFDHVAPLAVKYKNPNGVAFDTTGPRTPTLVASPFAPRGVSHVALDNTSILQLLAERFGKPGETYSPQVAGRMQQNIASVSAVLSADASNTSIARLGAPTAHAHSIAPPAPPSAMHAAFEVAAESLVFRHGREAIEKYPELGAQRRRSRGA